jgi:hypothetical protein
MIGQNTIDLFRHPPIERPQAGFHMSNRNVKLRCREGARQRRIGIAINDNPIGLFRFHDRLDRDEHPSRHFAVVTPVDVKIVLRRGYTQFIEEYVRHISIEVLAGMHHNLGESFGFPNRPTERGRLDELRAGTDGRQDFQSHQYDLTNQENCVAGEA